MKGEWKRVRQYRGIARNAFASELSYKEQFLTRGVSYVVYYFVLYLLWKAIYGDNSSLNGLTFSDAFVSLILTTCIFECTNSGIEWAMCFEMIKGDIIIKLVRPTDYMLYMFYEKLGGAMSGFFVFVLPVFVFTYFLFPGKIITGIQLLLFFCCFILSFCMMFLIEFMLGLLSFCTQSVWGISTIKELVMGFFAGAAVPIAFFPDPLMWAAEHLPFKSMYYDPVRMLLDRGIGVQGGVKILVFQMLWLLFLFGTARILFRAMAKRIVINGG